MPKEDYYKTLGVKKDTSPDQIKVAYRKSAMKYHPDRNKDNKDAEQKFKDCSEAYEVLSNPEKKELYDRYGHNGLKNAGVRNYSHMNVNDIFSHFGDIFGFRSRNANRANRPLRGRNVETYVQIKLEDINESSKIKVKYKRAEVCDKCNGSGCAKGKSKTTCSDCQGTGQITSHQRPQGGMFVQFSSPCSHCRGQGKVVLDPCEKCKGSTRILKDKNIEVQVPYGIHEGQTIRIARYGEAGKNGGPSGDLFCHIEVEEHPIFNRNEDDIRLQFPVSFIDVLLGKEIEVPTLNGNKTINIPPGTDERVFTIKGVGLPNIETKRKGDQLVVLDVQVPDDLTDGQKEIIEQNCEKSSFAKIDNFRKEVKKYQEKKS